MSVLNKPPVRLEGILRMEKISIIASHILVVLMMGCVGLTITQVALRLVPDLRMGYFPWLCMLLSLEALVAVRTTRRQSDMDSNPMLYILIQVVLIFLVVKLFIYFWEGIGQLFIDIPQWTHNFLGVFFNGEYQIALFVSIAVWGLSRFIGLQLLELEGDESFINPDPYGGLSSDRAAVRRTMMGLMFSVGFVLIAIVSLMYIEVRFRPQSAVNPRLGLAAVLAYFLMGMALLSQTQFSVLRASWAWEKLTVDPVMIKRWIAYSLIFLLVLSVLAFVLPTGYSLGFLATLQIVIQLLIMGAYALLFLITFPFIWLLSLFGRGQKGTEKLPPTTPPSFPKLQNTPSAPIPWVEVLKSVLFWVIFLAVIVFAIRQYLRQNQELAQKLKKFRVFNWLAGAWKWLLNALRGWNEGISQAVQSGIQRLRARREIMQLEMARRFVSLRRMSPREKVMFYYLAMVRRSGEQGIERKPSQTPQEFTGVLHSNVPTAGEDLDQITQAFMEARYTRHEISPTQAGFIREVWERIKRALRSI